MEPTIVVCEDHEDSRVLLARIVRSSGFSVIETATGHEAVTAILENDVQCAFLDIGLPDMDGYEIARVVRAARPSSPPRLIAVTGHNSARDLKLSREAGFHLHLAKPIEMDKIVAVLSTLRTPIGSA